MEKNGRKNWLQIFVGRTDRQTDGKLIYRLGLPKFTPSPMHYAERRQLRVNFGHCGEKILVGLFYIFGSFCFL